VTRGEVWPQLDDDLAAGRKGKRQAVGVGHELNSG
jgi:hypothetical protein